MVAEARRAHGWTQPQLAEASGVALRTVQDVESAKHRNPQARTHRALCQALDLPIDRTAPARGLSEKVTVTVDGVGEKSVRFEGTPRAVALSVHQFLTLIDPS